MEFSTVLLINNTIHKNIDYRNQNGEFSVPIDVVSSLKVIQLLPKMWNDGL